jgi:hypothetical protein
MNNLTYWSFQNFTEWLSQKAEKLKQQGCSVEFHVQTEMQSTARLRVENAAFLGELIVWENGHANQIIASLETGNYLFESDGKPVGSPPYDIALQRFFNYFKAKQL